MQISRWSHVFYWQDYQVNIYLRQAWQDPRLKWTPPNEKMKVMRLGDKEQEKTWKPDTFFRNEKKAKFHEVTVNNRMMKVKPDGGVWYVTK
jgi:hypothetical protein